MPVAAGVPATTYTTESVAPAVKVKLVGVVEVTDSPEMPERVKSALEKAIVAGVNELFVTNTRNEYEFCLNPRHVPDKLGVFVAPPVIAFHVAPS